MIGFWIVAAALTALALLPLVRALLRPSGDVGEAASFARGVYAQQVAEVERDLARGVLTPDQAKLARAEIGRRLLSAAAEADKLEAVATQATKPSRKLALALTLAMPVVALGIYLPTGHPNMPAQIFAERPKGRAVPEKVLEAVASLEKSLQENPNDQAGWTLLGQTYAAMGRIDDAAMAYRRALGLSQGDPELMSALAETLTSAADGIVGEEAHRLFDEVVKADPNNPRARYYLGVARQQAGDIKGALDRWTALVGDSPADAPWLPLLMQQIQQAAVSVGLDPVAITPKPKPPANPQTPRGPMQGGGTGAGGGAAPALSAEQMQAMAGMSAEDQQATINSMVDGLEAKLKDNPGDVDGWLRLARAREVQGNLDAARDALRGAVKADPGRVQAWLDLSRLLAPDTADGKATPEFLAAMEKVLALQPQNPQALYYLGQQAANQGDTAKARDYWQKLVNSLPANAPERPELQRRLDALGK
ncbi:c-type cytochrome biogenesis protein CcmI [Niveispirillum sp. BGYR6]|uniref:c-type cytochrome biogenesis protein CcmI n=1 Tax=Niveispirillum sp. BGYR6 TaxID=2971249 RepID=UPI0022B96F48|nr:c-type cytochrome biogenesis protein CcmI [Niveispirillum sp. BGYR6]MDG5495797.1 c-type cytochrome biogenesis protein CcmI [Niveispirillum sp. BGYR6]